MVRAPTKSAIVTGSSRGIGRAIAQRLSRDGFAVVVNYAGNAAKALEVVAEIERDGGRAIAVQGDVSKAANVQRLFERAITTFGAVDVVVNCAAIQLLRPIAGGDLDAFDQTIATNLRGAFLVLSQAAQHVRTGGRIIAITTSVIAKSFPNYGAYIASKAGVEGLVRVLANELRGCNVTVNA
ncbi:MAG TPA: SDR family NAD(P)-dependent oxidoreductase, partial [Polyangiaceae bacterium]|nr:SDR family NAD(P)-dependent oxidoreductase [Polyangiaceae bacterium]